MFFTLRIIANFAFKFLNKFKNFRMKFKLTAYFGAQKFLSFVAKILVFILLSHSNLFIDRKLSTLILLILFRHFAL